MDFQLIKIRIKVIELNNLSNNICITRTESLICKMHIYKFLLFNDERNLIKL
jgi:hypothetical protein